MTFTPAHLATLNELFVEIAMGNIGLPISTVGVSNINAWEVYQSHYRNHLYNINTLIKWKKQLDTELTKMNSGSAFLTEFGDNTTDSAALKRFSLWSRFLDYVIARNKSESEEELLKEKEAENKAAKKALFLEEKARRDVGAVAKMSDEEFNKAFAELDA